MGQNKNLKKQKQNKFTVGGSRSAATTKIQVDGRGARYRSRSANDFNKFRTYQQRRSQSHSQSRMVQLLHTGGGSRKSAITESGQTRSCAPITRYDQTKSWSPTSKTIDPVQLEVFVDLEAQMNHKKQKKCCCPVWAIILLILLGIVLVVALIFYFTRDEENPTSSSSPTSSSTITRPSGPSRAELERREKARLEEQELRKKEQELLEADQELCKKEQDACTKKEKDKVKKEREQLKKEQELHKKNEKDRLEKEALERKKREREEFEEKQRLELERKKREKEEKNPSGYIHKPWAVNSAFAQPKKNHSMEQHNRDRNRRAAHAKRQRDLAAAAAAYGAAFDKSTKELAIENEKGILRNKIHYAERNRQGAKDKPVRILTAGLPHRTKYRIRRRSS